ncbi:MAG TPA: hypothetical protein VHM89_11535 [Acidimicrobiales bacterium]|nr:hypothetical protein [Acidimicrobiales bacterium]
MPDQPPDPDADEGGASGALDTPPAVPAIDLSEPEEPAPTSPLTGGPLVSAPDATSHIPPESPATPVASPPLAGEGDGAVPPAPPVPTVPPSDPVAPGSETEPSGSPKGQAWKMVLVVAVFLAVVVVAYLLGKKGGGDSQDEPSSTSTTAVDTKPVDTSSWATFTDDAAGFTIKHPKDWQKLPTQSAERLVLRAGAESAAQVTVRNIESSTAPDVIQQVMADSSLVEQPREFDLNGLPAVVYIFNTPVDADSPDPGVAVQYFVVGPHKLYTIVFVTRPPEELNRLGRIFSAVASTFKSTSDTPAPEPSSTTSTTG